MLVVGHGPSPGPAPLPFDESVRAGGTLYLSGQIGIAPGSTAPASGGIEAETRQAMENVGAVLRRNGLTFRDLVKCTAMLTDMTRWSDFNRVYASYFPDGRFPARSAIGAAALALGSHVEIECVAHFPNEPSALNAETPLGPYSQAVAVGRTVYISGIVPFDAGHRRFAPAEIEQQMSQVLANLNTILGHAGLSRRDIVKTSLFLRSAADMPKANKSYAAYFAEGAKPARTMVAGADWGRSDILVELDAIAVRSDRGPAWKGDSK